MIVIEKWFIDWIIIIIRVWRIGGNGFRWKNWWELRNEIKENGGFSFEMILLWGKSLRGTIIVESASSRNIYILNKYFYYLIDFDLDSLVIVFG